MANRVIIGKRGSDHGLFVSKPGSNVVSADRKDLIFDSTDLRTSAIHGIKEVSISSGSTNASVNLNSNGSSMGFIPFVLWTQISGNDVLGQIWHFSFSPFSGPAFAIGSDYMCEVTNTSITMRNSMNGTSAATFKILVFNIPAE